MEANKDSGDCWNICRPHATILITIFPEQKRETFRCKTRTKRNHAWPGKKKKFKHFQHLKSHSEPNEDSTLLFIFPDLAHTNLLFMLSEDQHYYLLKANSDFYLSSWIIHGKTPINVNGIRIWNHTFAAHSPENELLVLQLPAMGEEP